MTGDERLKTIRLKIERAIKHIDELAIVCKRFVDTNPYKIGRETDPKTGYYHFSIHDPQTPPPEVALIAGDAIHNLRSALDHLAYQLVLVNGNVPTRHTCFPIFDDPNKYKILDPRKVDGMSQAAKDAITAANPYKGGNDALWLAHDLDIADKHHSLLTTLVAVSHGSIDLHTSLNNFKAPPFALPNFREPLKDGDVFFICEPGLENDTKIAFAVAFCEPEIIKGEPIVPTLGKLVKHINSTIVAFEPLLA